ncbi:glycosyltransferase [Flavihumibacter petaseus]|uniref:Putative glycosyltransferase n=1 Tax=Flavihumibacter petaseus NBRC 106054 TaxID=1220578 RepID=A0A0E9MYM9_9BACT|nr:glycosyltransferase [Flavihumibacter petaseus]GAO42837.1 putative glycosyltransferase [Flavihumibacter petaseus NBRC 106054]
MPKVAYYIDPLLEYTVNHAEQSILGAIPDLVSALLPAEQVALTLDPELTMESHEGLELVHLPVPKITWRSRERSRVAVFEAWNKKSPGTVLVQFSPGRFIPAQGNPTVLFTTSEAILAAPRAAQWAAAHTIVLPSAAAVEKIRSAFPRCTSRIISRQPLLEQPAETLGWAGQEQVKLKYTNGRDYCLYAGSLSASQGAMPALKAYSLFKKWLMTGMPLVLAGRSTEETADLERLLTTYKYKADVLLYPDPEEEDWRNLVAGAYMLVHTQTTGDHYPLEWALSAGTPAACVQSQDLGEWPGDAVLWAAADDHDQLAHALMLLYKDEGQRNTLIEKGKKLAMEYNREHTLKAWAGIINDRLAEIG